MKHIVIPVVLASLVFAVCGCTTKSRLIADPSQAEVVAGFSMDDIVWAADVVVKDVERVNARYAQPAGGVRIIDVKNITNDTLSRGRDAGALADALGQAIREGLANGGRFAIIDETLCVNAEKKPVPEFILHGRIFQRNMRKDNGDVYQEFYLNAQLVDPKTGLQVWQKSLPLRKEVDAKNSMVN